MTRINRALQRAADAGRPALVTFLTAGDPDLRRTVDLVLALERGGSDVIEIGVPFSDPVIDGPTIQAASERALKSGTTLPGIFDTVRAIRQRSDVALVLYSYVNPLLRFGIDKVAKTAVEIGIDGMLTVDLPVGDDVGLLETYRAAGLDRILLVAPTTGPARMAEIVKQASGFIYAVSLAGVTGVRDPDEVRAARMVAEIKRLTDLPVAVGVGIKTPAQVAAIGRSADAVVVGSALIKVIEAGGDDPVGPAEAFTRSLADALPRRTAA